MYRCPHCSARLKPVWRLVFARRNRTIRCLSCGGEARFSDKARFVEVVCAELLALPLVLTLLVLPWWGAVLALVGAVFALPVVVNLLIPLVPAEPFGSAADIKRAAIHFWLIAPIALVILVAVLMAVVTGQD